MKNTEKTRAQALRQVKRLHDEALLRSLNRDAGLTLQAVHGSIDEAIVAACRGLISRLIWEQHVSLHMVRRDAMGAILDAERRHDHPMALAIAAVLMLSLPEDLCRD